MLKFKRAYTHGPLFGGDGAEAVALGMALLAQAKRPRIQKPPTVAQLLKLEQSDWNAEVDRRKAEKQEKKGGQHG